MYAESHRGTRIASVTRDETLDDNEIRLWREDDVVLVEPWDWQDEKSDISWRSEKSEADPLREEGHIA
jgi:initiation factor 1A